MVHYVWVAAEKNSSSSCWMNMKEVQTNFVRQVCFENRWWNWSILHMDGHCLKISKHAKSTVSWTNGNVSALRVKQFPQQIYNHCAIWKKLSSSNISMWSSHVAISVLRCYEYCKMSVIWMDGNIAVSILGIYRFHWAMRLILLCEMSSGYDGFHGKRIHWEVQSLQCSVVCHLSLHTQPLYGTMSRVRRGTCSMNPSCTSWSSSALTSSSQWTGKGCMVNNRFNIRFHHETHWRSSH